VVACGTLRREITQLADSGLLDPDRLLFTAPGLHEWPRKLATQLTRQLQKAAALAEHVIVVYGESCYYDFERSMDTDALVAEVCAHAVRVRAKTCVDMLADKQERERIAGGARVYWFTPGWIEHWDFIFRDWDVGQANETFPGNEKGVVLDAVGYFDEVSRTDPQKLLKICDWAKMPLEAHAVSLDRPKRLLRQCAERFVDGAGKAKADARKGLAG